MAKPRRTRDEILDEFLAEIDTSAADRCWEWTGRVDKDGYGLVPRGERGPSHRAHRLVWERENGPIPDGSLVCHACDNPRCINPAHLFLGTPLDNMRDKMAKGRHRARTILDEKQIIEILADPRPYREIAEHFNVSSVLISQIKNRKVWNWVEAETVIRNPATAWSRRSTRIDESAAIAIRADPRPYQQIADTHGVSLGTINAIKSERRWAHVGGPLVRPGNNTYARRGH